MSLPTELHDLLPLPPQDNRYFRSYTKKGIQHLLELLTKKYRYESVIQNHKNQLKYHEEKLKEAELRMNIVQSQIAFSKEKVKKELQTAWEDIKETEEME